MNTHTRKLTAKYEQYVQKDGRRYTYGIEFLGKRDCSSLFPFSIAIFKVYSKKKYSFWDRVFNREKKEVGKRMFAWYLHPYNNDKQSKMPTYADTI